MKKILIAIGLSLCAAVSAQQAFVFQTDFQGAVTNVPASGVTAAHTVSNTYVIARVGILTPNGILELPPTKALVKSETNLTNAALIQKPLLSAQRPAPPRRTNAPPHKAAVKIPGQLPNVDTKLPK